jgi:hypothetical protein
MSLTRAKPENPDSDIAAQKAFLKTHRGKGEKVGLKSNAEEVLRAMERRKRDIGPGLERGGCTLASEARRGTFGGQGVWRVIGVDD